MGRGIEVGVGRVIAALLRGAGVACVILGTSAPQAATLTVINNNDSGVGSLRAEVAAAASGDTINFAPSVTGTITLTSGEIDINTNLTITGPGASVLTVSGNNNSLVFNVMIGGFTVTISGLTISGGKGNNGGGIFNGGTMTLTNSVVSNNTVVGLGGGIFNFFSLTLNNSTVSGNSAGNSGGGIYSEGALTLTNSVVSGNTATNGGGIANFGTMALTYSTVSGNAAPHGGGIYSNVESTPTLSNSTVSGNTSQFGGGIETNGTLTVINSTISGNAAGGGEGAGIRVDAGTTTLTNVTIAGNGSAGEAQLTVDNSNGAAATAESTIIANPLGGGNNCGGVAPTSNGFNLDSANSCAFGMPTDLINTNPLLGPLQNNGGPTFTLALLSGSPAIDKGSNPLALPFDQRGPGFARVVGVAADIGAFEVQGAPPSTAALVPTLNDVALLALSALSALAGVAALRRRRRA